MESFTIGDLESLSGIKAHTIRIWEQRYNLLNPQRNKSNVRSYDSSDLKKLLNVALLNKNGLRISQICKMNEDEIRQRVLDLSIYTCCEGRLVNDLMQATINLEVGTFENIINNYIVTKGIQKAMTQLLVPFLRKSNALWSTGYLNSANEKIVVNIIRQKLVVAVESTYPVDQLNTSVLLFLPEGEYHEIALLYIYYLLKSNGFQVLYMGINVSLDQISSIFKKKHIDYLFTHLIMGGCENEKFVESLKSFTHPVNLVLSGAAVKRFSSMKFPKHIQIETELEGVVRLVNKLK